MNIKDQVKSLMVRIMATTALCVTVITETIASGVGL